jgi:hypothetical protein
LATPFDNTVPSNDVDFFLLGQMERRKQFTDYVSHGGQIQGPYGDMIGVAQEPDPPAHLQQPDPPARAQPDPPAQAQQPDPRGDF